MSYILDALKKSEQERSLGSSPTLESHHGLLHEQKLEPGYTKILIVIIVLICVIAAALAYYLYSLNLQTQQALLDAKNSVQLMQEQNNQVAQNNFKSRVPETNNQQQQIEGTQQIESSQETVPDEDIQDEDAYQIVRPSKERKIALQQNIQAEAKKDEQLKTQYQEYFDAQQNKTSESQINPDENTDVVIAAQDDIEEISWQDIDTVYELDENLKAILPKIEVTTHIYSSAASFRRVTINDKTAKEGAEIEQGLVLERITEEGVVFLFNDYRFRMNAIDEWSR